MKRAFGFFLAVALFTGGATACGDDDKDDTSTEATDGASTDEGTDEGSTDSGNAEVQAYCDAIEEFVAKYNDMGTDSAKAAELATEAQELSTKAQALTGISAEEAQEVADCTEEMTSAMTAN